MQHRLRLRWKLICLLVCCLPYAVSEAGIIHDSHLTWMTQQSDHFIIHYHDGEAQLAEQSLHIAESVHHKLSPLFDWQPKDKTDIILSDETDLSNGFATPFPSNRMTLFVSQPNSIYSLEDHLGWLEMLILHEYVHILHMDKASGWLHSARSIFGRFPLLFPNTFMPPWMLEGLATYLETDIHQGIGRGQSSYFAMMMRLEVASGVKPVRQINQPMLSWPLLTSRYLYGVYFYQFLAESYGADTWQKIVKNYAFQSTPYSINDMYEDVLEKDVSTLWDEFTVYLQHKFNPQIAALTTQAGMQAQTITSTGDFKRSLLLADDGRLFFVSDNLLTGAKLMVKKPTGITTTLADLNTGANLDFHAQSGLLVAQPDICNNVSKYYDLYRIDPDSGAATRLTHCQRYIYAAWSTDGQQIVAVSNANGQHALHMLDAKGTLQKILWQGEHDETLSHIDWSADDKTVLTSMWRAQRGWDIEAFDMLTKKWTALTHDTAIETDVRYLGTSLNILFSSDATAVYNIHQLNQDGKRYRLTQVLGGAFSPYMDQQQQLFYVGYTAQGFDVFASPQPTFSPYMVPPATSSQLMQQAPTPTPAPTIHISKATPYTAWQSMMPQYWFPVWGWTDQGSEYGISTSGSDALKKHQYSLYLGYHGVSQTPTYQISYSYDGWNPLLRLSTNQTQRPYTDKNGFLIALSQEQQFDASLIYPDLSIDMATTLQLGISYQKSQFDWVHQHYVVNDTRPAKDVLLGIAWSKDSRQRYPRATNYTQGTLWTTTLETGQALTGDYAGTTLSTTWQQHIDVHDGKILGMWRGKLAWQSNDARSFQLGGAQQTNLPATNNLLQWLSPFNQRNFPLRGYSNQEAALQGHRIGLLTAEVRMPIARIERGWMAPPIGLDQLFWQVFVDAGAVNRSQVYTSAGVELGADLVFFYNLKLRMFAGYAQGFDKTLGGRFTYLRLASAF